MSELETQIASQFPEDLGTPALPTKDVSDVSSPALPTQDFSDVSSPRTPRRRFGLREDFAQETDSEEELPSIPPPIPDSCFDAELRFVGTQKCDPQHFILFDVNSDFKFDLGSDWLCDVVLTSKHIPPFVSKKHAEFEYDFALNAWTVRIFFIAFECVRVQD